MKDGGEGKRETKGLKDGGEGKGKMDVHTEKFEGGELRERRKEDREKEENEEKWRGGTERKKMKRREGQD